MSYFIDGVCCCLKSTNIKILQEKNPKSFRGFEAIDFIDDPIIFRNKENDPMVNLIYNSYKNIDTKDGFLYDRSQYTNLFYAIILGLMRRTLKEEPEIYIKLMQEYLPIGKGDNKMIIFIGEREKIYDRMMLRNGPELEWIDTRWEYIDAQLEVFNLIARAFTLPIINVDHGAKDEIPTLIENIFLG